MTSIRNPKPVSLEKQALERAQALQGYDFRKDETGEYRCVAGRLTMCHDYQELIRLLTLIAKV